MYYAALKAHFYTQSIIIFEPGTAGIRPGIEELLKKKLLKGRPVHY